MAAYWKIAAHSTYDMCSMYRYRIVNFVFFSTAFKWSNVLDGSIYVYAISIVIQSQDRVRFPGRPRFYFYVHV